MKNAIWEEVKAHIKSGLPQNTFSLWINPITFLGEEENTVVLGCPNKFSRNWVEENFLGLIQDKFHKAGAGGVDLALRVGPQKKTAPADKHLPRPDNQSQPFHGRLCLGSGGAEDEIR
jgi:chromosomal replication initiation ATPase DnaA